MKIEQFRMIGKGAIKTLIDGQQVYLSRNKLMARGAGIDETTTLAEEEDAIEGRRGVRKTMLFRYVKNAAFQEMAGERDRRIAGLNGTGHFIICDNDGSPFPAYQVMATGYFSIYLYTTFPHQSQLMSQKSNIQA